ncbi:MAG: undecaprenyl/decaprenyl-phosphate alpha-N-acetylglucosaminyl 1-phosphate transferase, partial [Solirubrobacterales bacterium]
YSDNRGNFDTTWTAVMIAILVLGVAASFYVIYVLEILKLRRFRFRQVAAKVEAPEPSDVDREVARELETGSFREPDPDTGEFQPPGGS